MTNAADMTALTRATATDWVAREERQTGSRMTAYDNVASAIGTSSSWLRKFVNNSADAKEPGWTVGWNILASYRQICERVEKAAENERVMAKALERRIDEAMASTAGMVASTESAEARREDPERA